MSDDIRRTTTPGLYLYFSFYYLNFLTLEMNTNIAVFVNLDMVCQLNQNGAGSFSMFWSFAKACQREIPLATLFETPSHSSVSWGSRSESPAACHSFPGIPAG
ncbi:MAG: hypothetical protein HFJ80_07115 [Clostridiales bacterium]|nr:hypothetical protein [Clostridiales bacterium]